MVYNETVHCFYYVFCMTRIMHVFSLLFIILCTWEVESGTFQLGVLTPHTGSRAFGYEVEVTIAMAVEKVSACIYSKQFSMFLYLKSNMC